MPSSMRYVRGSDGNIPKNQNDSARGRGSSRIITSHVGGRLSRGRGRGRGGGAYFSGRGGVGCAGRFSGRGRSSYSFVRGAPSANIHGSATAVPNNFSFENSTPEFPGTGNRWVRNSDKNDDTSAMAALNVPESKELKFPLEDSTQTEKISRVGSADINPQPSLERRGKHKLVGKRDRSQITAAPAALEQISSGSTERHVSVEIEKIDGSYARAKTVFSGNNSWKRPSSQSSDDHYPKNEVNNTIKSSAEKQNYFTRGTQNGSVETEIKKTPKKDMGRRGFGKLVLKSGDTKQNDTGAMSQVPFSGNTRLSWNRQTPDISRGAKAHNATSNSAEKPNSGRNTWHAGSHHGKRKRADPSQGPRRIALSKPWVSENSNNLKYPAEGEETSNAPGGQDAVDANDKSSSADVKSPPSEKTLTDFCYKSTGRGGGGDRGGGRGRGRGRGGGREIAGRSMGLVRVKPQNPSSTPICPTFRRGLPCNNPKCTLRHDVCTEASRPICVFFQRNGMCSKGDDCPFRHVKVRWDAEICPVFAKVGYCEDPDCSLRHVLAKKSRVELSTK